MPSNHTNIFKNKSLTFLGAAILAVSLAFGGYTFLNTNTGKQAQAALDLDGRGYTDNLNSPHQEAVYNYNYENILPTAPGYFEIVIPRLTGANPIDLFDVTSITETFPLATSTYAAVAGTQTVSTNPTTAVYAAPDGALGIRISPQITCAASATGCTPGDIPGSTPSRLTIKISLKTSAPTTTSVSIGAGSIIFPQGIDIASLQWRINSAYVRTNTVLDPAIVAVAAIRGQGGTGTPVVGQPYTVVTSGITAVNGAPLNSPNGTCRTTVGGTVYIGTGIINGVCTVNVTVNITAAAILAGTVNLSDGGTPRAIVSNGITYAGVTPAPLPLAVTINQAATQADPAASSPVRFTAVFNQSIDTASFAGSDITLSGTASGATVTSVNQVAPNNGTTFEITVATTGAGTVIASIPMAVTGFSSSVLGTTGTTPRAITIDSAGNIYTANFTANNVSRITPAGVSTILGTTGTGPRAIAIDSAGNIYTANSTANNVSRITPAGVSSILGTTGTGPVGITIDAAGNIYTANETANNVSRITPAGVSSILGTTGANPVAITIDSAGNIYTANRTSNNVTKLTLGLGSGVRTTSGIFNQASTSADNTITINGTLALYAGDSAKNNDICSSANITTGSLVDTTISGQSATSVTCSAAENSITLTGVTVASKRQFATATINDIIFEDLWGLNTANYSVTASISNFVDPQNPAKNIILGSNPDALNNETDPDRSALEADKNKIFVVLDPSGATVTVLRSAATIADGVTNYTKGSRVTLINSATQATLLSTTSAVRPGRIALDGVLFKLRIPSLLSAGNFQGTIVQTVI